MRKFVRICGISCALLLVQNLAHADYWLGLELTPKGSLVEVLIAKWDYTPAQKQSINIAFLQAHPDTLLYADATRMYNCHALIWGEGMTPGGWGTSVWLNQINSSGFFNVHEFWWDGSFVQYTYLNSQNISGTLANSFLQPAQANIMFYDTGDHSAAWMLGTWSPGEAVSKWGEGPRLRHYIDDHPYGNSGIMFHYKAP